MATHKECECIKSALMSIIWANSLENNAMLASKADIILRDEIILDDTRIGNINNLIYRDAIKLRSYLKGIDKNCQLPFSTIDQNNLMNGRGRLNRVINTRGSNIDAATYSSTLINNTLRDMLFKKNLIRCTD